MVIDRLLVFYDESILGATRLCGFIMNAWLRVWLRGEGLWLNEPFLLIALYIGFSTNPEVLIS